MQMEKMVLEQNLAYHNKDKQFKDSELNKYYDMTKDMRDKIHKKDLRIKELENNNNDLID
jgi:hypothetical protein